VGQVVPGRRGYHINNAYGHDGLKLSDIQGSYRRGPKTADFSARSVSALCCMN